MGASKINTLQLLIFLKKANIDSPTVLFMQYLGNPVNFISLTNLKFNIFHRYQKGKTMEFFKRRTDINFFKLRIFAAAFSCIIFLISIVAFFYNGLNLGLDFTGGTEIQLSFKKSVKITSIRKKLQEAGFNKIEVQSYGNSKTILVTLAETKGQHVKNQNEYQQKIVKSVLKTLPKSMFNRANYIGAKVSGELTYHAVLAVIIAIIATILYIAFRFEFKLAIGAAVALIHDPVLILGVFSFFQIQFDLTTLAAVLTILGYSLHDTIVIFDRIRENFRKIRRGTPVQVVNAAVNETISRTIISASLTLIVVVVLFFFRWPIDSFIFTRFNHWHYNWYLFISLCCWISSYFFRIKPHRFISFC